MGIVTMKELLEAGVHFGHQTRRWDPRMKPYIFTERNGIHIIDLQKTIAALKIAYNAIKETAKNGGIILFVGTKKQAQSAIVQEATRCGMPYVANRWLGGMITNFNTIKNSINRLKRIERMEVDGSFDLLTKKEVIKLQREKEKLLKNIGGIKDMEKLPDMIFIVDPKKEAIALTEAMKSKIPIVAIVDTNCNPEGIDYPIPGNDDAIRAINLFCAIVSSAVIEGQNEAGRFEITEETEIISLAETEEEKKAREIEEEEGYIEEEVEIIDTGIELDVNKEKVKDEEKVEEPSEQKDSSDSERVSVSEESTSSADSDKDSISGNSKESEFIDSLEDKESSIDESLDEETSSDQKTSYEGISSNKDNKE